MHIIIFSSDFNTIDEWRERHNIEGFTSCYDMESLQKEIKEDVTNIVIVDYDSVASELNKLISSANLPEHTIVLERTPEIATGKMLIKRGVKAYGNSKISTPNYMQLLEAVIDDKVWTYPELTMALVKNTAVPTVNDDATTLIQNRLTPKEIEVIYFILDGLTNNAIASQLNITTRTVKAHVSSIFSKLHVSDRISLVLLLK